MKNWPIIVLATLCVLLTFNTVLHLFNLNKLGQVQDQMDKLKQRTVALEKSIELMEPELLRLHALTGRADAMDKSFSELKTSVDALKTPTLKSETSGAGNTQAKDSEAAGGKAVAAPEATLPAQ